MGEQDEIMSKPEKPRGYTPCPCRDCFEIAFDGELCWECAEADCDCNGQHECKVERAFDDCDR